MKIQFFVLALVLAVSAVSAVPVSDRSLSDVKNSLAELANHTLIKLGDSMNQAALNEDHLTHLKNLEQKMEEIRNSATLTEEEKYFAIKKIVDDERENHLKFKESMAKLSAQLKELAAETAKQTKELVDELKKKLNTGDVDEDLNNLNVEGLTEEEPAVSDLSYNDVQKSLADLYNQTVTKLVKSFKEANLTKEHLTDLYHQFNATQEYQNLVHKLNEVRESATLSAEEKQAAAKQILNEEREKYMKKLNETVAANKEKFVELSAQLKKMAEETAEKTRTLTKDLTDHSKTLLNDYLKKVEEKAKELVDKVKKMNTGDVDEDLNNLNVQGLFEDEPESDNAQEEQQTDSDESEEQDFDEERNAVTDSPKTAGFFEQVDKVAERAREAMRQAHEWANERALKNVQEQLKNAVEKAKEHHSTLKQKASEHGQAAKQKVERLLSQFKNLVRSSEPATDEEAQLERLEENQ